MPERVTRDDGSVRAWKVRYTDVDGAARSRSFLPHEKLQAAAFQNQVAQMRRRDRAPAGRSTLAEFMARWWDEYATQELSQRTLNTYAAVWNQFAPMLGPLELDRLTPKAFDDFKRAALADGAGPTSVAKALQVCQAALRQGVIWGVIDHNPVPVVRKPRQSALLVVLPTMSAVETTRQALAGGGRRGSAALVSTLAYAGLRPEEARALRWADVRKNTLLVANKCEPDGEIVPGSKTGRRYRTVELLRPLAADLNEWRLGQGRPDHDRLIFPKNGQPDLAYGWTDSDFRNWRGRVYRPAAADAGLPQPGKPYALRHAFASLLLAAGRNPIEVAAQLGHSPSMLLDTYSHVIAELRETAGPVDPAGAIYSAREAAGRQVA